MEAQIVSFEVADIPGLSVGWFFWTFKTEGGGYAEWDFLRGVKEGWVPTIAPPNVTSQSLYGTCDQIHDRTNETMDIVHAFPWGDEPYWGVHVASTDSPPPSNQQSLHSYSVVNWLNWFLVVAILLVATLWYVVRKRCSKKRQYSTIGSIEV
jgi:hypothetical protein